MYQFYYANEDKVVTEARYEKNVLDEYEIVAVRPTMWEEHCLECSAPYCFKKCVHYTARKDGRCKRFENGIYVKSNPRGCGEQSARLKFRKWANMMTIIFPAMLSVDDYAKMIAKNQHLGQVIKVLVDSKIPASPKFTCIRVPEFMRRRKLRKLKGADNTPTAFIFHGYSFEKEEYQLILEVFNDHNPVFKLALTITPGENLHIIESDRLSPECWKTDYLVKIYPENNIEADLEILWCDFVQGRRRVKEKPAQKVKCVVWDLDNTIWQGILIETEDTSCLSLRNGVLDTIKLLDERGILQSIASKNSYDSAWPVVEKMGISEYFLYPQINWEAKSFSMSQIAKRLNIGIDSLVLIDDSEFERRQVEFAWPQIRTYSEREVPGILTKPEFDVLVTEDSKKRREMYKAEENRQQIMAGTNTDTLMFLKKCHLRTSIFVPEKEELARCYELVVRTNQLNMSGIKYSQDEFSSVLNKKDHNIFAFSCEDDFGRYGLVGFGQYRTENDVLFFTEFAMSCRVAGKYVESALFSFLLRENKCDMGIFKVNKTKKNILLRNCLREIGFTIEEEDEKSITYIFGSSLLNNEVVGIQRR